MQVQHGLVRDECMVTRHCQDRESNQPEVADIVITVLCSNAA